MASMQLPSNLKVPEGTLTGSALVLGNGPTRQGHDWSGFRGTTLGCNLPDVECDWLVGVDRVVSKDLIQRAIESANLNVIVALWKNLHMVVERDDVTNVFFATRDKFSFCAAGVTATQAAIQMGFDTIYLAGFDWDAEHQKVFWVDVAAAHAKVIKEAQAKGINIYRAYDHGPEALRFLEVREIECPNSKEKKIAH